MECLEKIYSWERLGYEVLIDNTKLIGKTPHKGSMAYLHTIFAHLSIKEISYLESKFGKKIPEDYKIFLSKTNGIHLFSGTLTLDGYRKSNSRKSLNTRYPFDLEITNVLERIEDSKSSYFFIGGYECIY